MPRVTYLNSEKNGFNPLVFRGNIKKNETIYSVDFGKVCKVCGLSESRMKHLICEPDNMKFETIGKIFRLYRFSSEQILECFR